MKIILTVLNIISAIPILAYPVILLGIPFSFNGSTFLNGLTVFCLVGYPIFIIALIYLSRQHNSLFLAAFALIPFFVIAYVFASVSGLSSLTENRKNFDTANKDFVCNENSFLTLKDFDDSREYLYLYKKKNFLSYEKEFIATIFDGKKMNLIRGVNSEWKTCKNTEGKSPNDLYKVNVLD